jgi:hypothetical protein
MDLLLNSRRPAGARSALLVLICCVFSLPAWSQSGNSYRIPRITAVPAIDGVISPNEWRAAISIDINIEVDPADSQPAEVSARGLVMEDGEVLYVAFIADDPEPDQIRAFYRDRDSVWDDDWVSIVLDTFNDERRAYEFFSPGRANGCHQ